MDYVWINGQIAEHWIFKEHIPLRWFTNMIISVMDTDSRHITIKMKKFYKMGVSGRDIKNFLKRLEKDKIISYEIVGDEVKITVLDSDVVIIPYKDGLTATDNN
jgi:hypothetical protein